MPGSLMSKSHAGTDKYMYKVDTMMKHISCSHVASFILIEWICQTEYLCIEYVRTDFQ